MRPANEIKQKLFVHEKHEKHEKKQKIKKIYFIEKSRNPTDKRLF